MEGQGWGSGFEVGEVERKGDALFADFLVLVLLGINHGEILLAQHFMSRRRIKMRGESQSWLSHLVRCLLRSRVREGLADLLLRRAYSSTSWREVRVLSTTMWFLGGLITTSWLVPQAAPIIE